MENRSPKSHQPRKKVSVEDLLAAWLVRECFQTAEVAKAKAAQLLAEYPELARAQEAQGLIEDLYKRAGAYLQKVDL